MTWTCERVAVKAHYESVFEEQRLATIGRFEYLRTLALIDEYLPRPRQAIGDVGGGPGTYAVPLAERGYAVHLVDPLASHVARALDYARASDVRLASSAVTDAGNLPWADESIDACLYFGPVYHLTDRRDRDVALAEARRVLKPGGLLIAKAISRFASMYAGFVRGLIVDPRYEGIVKEDLASGQHRNPTADPRWFTTAFYHLPAEFRQELVEAQFTVENLIGLDGPAAVVADMEFWLDDDERRATLLDFARKVAGEPSLLGASSQFVAIARVG